MHMYVHIYIYIYTYTHLYTDSTYIDFVFMLRLLFLFFGGVLVAITVYYAPKPYSND